MVGNHGRAVRWRGRASPSRSLKMTMSRVGIISACSLSDVGASTAKRAMGRKGGSAEKNARLRRRSAHHGLRGDRARGKKPLTQLCSLNPMKSRERAIFCRKSGSAFTASLSSSCKSIGVSPELHDLFFENFQGEFCRTVRHLPGTQQTKSGESSQVSCQSGVGTFSATPLRRLNA